MELFHEYRNKSVRAFLILVERIKNGEVLSKLEFEAEYYKLACDSNRITKVFYNNVINNEKIMIFDFSDPKQVVLCENSGKKTKNNRDKKDVHLFSIPLTIEKMWLNTAINDKLRVLFFSDEELSDIGLNGSEYPLYYRDIDDEWRRSENISEDSARNFRDILQAINEKKTISYGYNGKSCEGTPLKLEYDERKCKIYMIIFGNRLIKSDISKLSDIRISGDASGNLPEVREEMGKNQGYKPVVFTVSDHKNRKAIERALLAFSVYDHVVEPIDEKTAKFTIHYYTMDLDLLIKDILAFGSDIIVESPKMVVNRIVDILTGI